MHLIGIPTLRAASLAHCSIRESMCCHYAYRQVLHLTDDGSQSSEALNTVEHSSSIKTCLLDTSLGGCSTGRRPWGRSRTRQRDLAGLGHLVIPPARAGGAVKSGLPHDPSSDKAAED